MAHVVEDEQVVPIHPRREFDDEIGDLGGLGWRLLPKCVPLPPDLVVGRREVVGPTEDSFQSFQIAFAAAHETSIVLVWDGISVMTRLMDPSPTCVHDLDLVVFAVVLTG